VFNNEAGPKAVHVVSITEKVTIAGNPLNVQTKIQRQVTREGAVLSTSKPDQ
jgi:hypothetical protein